MKKEAYKTVSYMPVIIVVFAKTVPDVLVVDLHCIEGLDSTLTHPQLR